MDIMNNENINISNISNNINIANNIDNIMNGYHLLQVFDNIDQQENFIGIEQQLFNSVTLKPNSPLPEYQQHFVENQYYDIIWEWCLCVDLERYIDLFSVLNMNYLYTIENNDQILNIIENNPNVDDLVNALKSLSLKDRMNVYMVGNNRDFPY